MHGAWRQVAPADWRREGRGGCDCAALGSIVRAGQRVGQAGLCLAWCALSAACTVQHMCVCVCALVCSCVLAAGIDACLSTRMCCLCVGRVLVGTNLCLSRGAGGASVHRCERAGCGARAYIQGIWQQNVPQCGGGRSRVLLPWDPQQQQQRQQQSRGVQLMMCTAGQRVFRLCVV